MLLIELKANLKDYVYMFKDSSIALRYLYGKCGGRTYSYYAGSKVMHNPGITDARFREVVEAINEEVRKNAIFAFEGLSKSLGILTEDLNLQLTNEESFLQNARVRGAGVGVAAAAVTSLLTGGVFWFLLDFGELLVHFAEEINLIPLRICSTKTIKRLGIIYIVIFLQK